MALTVDEVKVLISAEIGPYKKAMEEAAKSTKEVSESVQKQVASVSKGFSGLKGLLAKLAIGTALFKLGKTSLQMALEVSASINQIKRIMGESTQAFLKWADNGALAYNMAKSDAIKYGAVYSNLFSNFIKDSDQLSGYTVKMLQASAVVASATGRSMDDVMNRIRSGMLGSTEAIEDLGINVNVAMIKSTNAFKQFANGQSWEQLDFNTQQAIRMMAILEQASTKYGDAVMEGPVSSLSYFVALLKDSALNIGNAFLPILQAIMPILNGFAMALRTVTGYLATFVQLLFGKTAEVSGDMSALTNDVKDMGAGLSDAGDYAGKLADGVGKVGKAAKKAKNDVLGLMGFDEINLLNKSKDASSDSGSGKNKGNGGKGIELPKVSLSGQSFTDDNNGMIVAMENIKGHIENIKKRFLELVNLFKHGFNLTFKADGIGQLKSSFDEVWQSVNDIFSDGKVAESMGNFLNRVSFALGQITGGIGNRILGVVNFVAESFNKSLKETKLDIKDWLIRNLENAGSIVSSVGNIAQNISQIFYDVLTSTPATDIGSHIITGITQGTMGIVELGMKLGRDLYAGVDTIITENKEKLVQSLTNLLSGVEPIFKSFSNLITNTFKKFNDVYDEYIKPFIDSVTQGISDLVGKVIEMWDTYINPVISEFGTTFQDLMEKHVQPTVDKFLELIGSISDLLNWLWENVIKPIANNLIEGLFPYIAAGLDFLGTVFNWWFGIVFGVFGGILQTIKGLIDFIVGVFTGDWEKAWNGIKDIVAGIWEVVKTIFSGAWDAVKAIFGGVGNWFKDRWKDIKNVFNGVKDFFSNIFQGAWDTITGIFEKIPKWFSDVFSKAWEGVRDIFSTGGKIFAGIVDGIAGVFKEVVNAIIDGINNVIAVPFDAINGVLRRIKETEIVGWQPFSWIPLLPVPQIPKLARGGIVDSATLAIVGEAGKEAVMPLENNTGWITELAQKLSDRMPTISTNQSSLPLKIVVKIGDNNTELGRALIKNINHTQEQAGQLLLNI